jgi:hypothetical protein
MNKSVMFFALPLALGLAACDSTPEADGSAAIDTSGNDLATDTSVVPPTDTDPPSALPGETVGEDGTPIDGTAPDVVADVVESGDIAEDRSAQGAPPR